MQRLSFAMFIAFLVGCTSYLYRETPPATFKGALDVRWVKNDYFVFIPNERDPLKLIRSDGTSIEPGIMYTDGGSIPRFLWGVKGLSPWGYAPAYIVHDWLFIAHQCDLAPDNTYKFKDSVNVMAESMKAVMENDPAARDSFAFDSIVAAIGSPIAERLWDKGVCNSPPREIHALPMGKAVPGDLLMTIRY